MERNMTQLTQAEQEHIITQLAPTIQRICKHYTNGFYYPNDLPTPMRLQFTETMEGFHRSYGNRISRSIVAGCMEYEDFDSIVQSVATVDVSERKRLANIIRATNRQVQQYRALIKLSNASSFLFISEQSDTTCDHCMSRHGQLYRIEDLQSGTDIPPLHPNCQCTLVALDMVMTLQYNQNKHWFVNQMTEMVEGHSGLLQMSGNGALSQITILDDGTPQIYHFIDNDVAIDGAMLLSSSVDRFVQWAMEFGGDAANLLDRWIQNGQAQLDYSVDMLSVNPFFAIVLFADAMTGTIASSILQIIESLASDLYEEPSLYNLFNLLTFGWVEVTEHALQPDDPWSFQHFIDMIGSVTFLLAAIKGVSSVASKFDDILNQHIDDVVIGTSDDVLMNVDTWIYKPDIDTYLEYQDIFDNPQFYNQTTGAINWPGQNGNSHIDGFLDGLSETITLEPGTIIDRYGSDFGIFASPFGTSYTERALAPGSALSKYNVFHVLEPITVEAGTVAPWFGEAGGGIQYILPHTIDELLSDGYIRRITP